MVKDLYGHHVADDLLNYIASVIRNTIRKTSIFARTYGEQFAFMVVYQNKEELTERIRHITTRTQQEVDEEIINYSYGIYEVTDNKMSIDRMMIYAAMALDTIENKPHNEIVFYQESMREKILFERELEAMMYKALDDKEFKVYLQPKYSPNGKEICGAEALVRWNSKSKGLISPGQFIPLFEKNMFIRKLDFYMLEEVCSLQRKWLDSHFTIVPISVNLSRKHIGDEDLIQKIMTIVDKYDLPHSCIELELTESAFFEDKTQIIHKVQLLRNNGFPVSMDDFGSGYSSLNSLKDLSFDIVKLDGEFFKTSDSIERSRTVVRDTISMAKHLNMKIVAEGIETKEQVDFLLDIGCDLIQGFYFAKPMPVDDFEDLMDYGMN